MKVVINRCHGGFGLSEEAIDMLLERKGVAFQKMPGSFGQSLYYAAFTDPCDETFIPHYDYYDDRADPDLIAVVEQLGERANDRYSELKIIEIPDDVMWDVDEYDGMEWVAERHRVWS